MKDGRVNSTNINDSLHALVIADIDDNFHRHCSQTLTEFEIPFTASPDIYHALVEIVKANYNSNIIVLGRLEQLSEEDGRFLEKLKEKRCPCCCLADKSSAANQEKMLDATQTGALIINDPDQIKPFVTELLNNHATAVSKESKTSEFFKKQFAISREEIDAILE